MKLVVIGGVAGGASAAARVRRLDAQAEIVMLERGEHVSFSNCCLPYHLSNTVADSNKLIMMTPQRFKAQHNIDARVHSEAVAIHRDRKTVTVRDTLTGETYEERYDKLVLAPGARPVMPRSIAGIDRANVFAIRNVTDIRALKACVDLPETKNIVVVGGGFIGIEAAENLRALGKEVALVEGMDQILAPFDHDMVQILHKELDDNGVRLYLNATVTAVEDGHVLARRGDEVFSVPADAVVMAIGVTPETELAREAGLEIGETRGIKVNHNYQTSDPDIYAVGDAVEIYNALTHRWGRLALAGPAQRQARAAADHMYGLHHNNRGYIGSSCLRVFNMNAASTGLNVRAAREAGFSCDSVTIYPNDKVGIMPGAHYMAFKLVFETPTGRILGAQAIGAGAADKRIDVIAAMITMGADLEDLKELELCYSPVFGTAKDVVNLAATAALNILYGRVRQVQVSEVRGLVESGAYIVDVREENEFAAGHLKGAHNVPLSQLTQRMDEIPKDVPVYLHCRSSQRSYYAICRLQGSGWRNVHNISGSFLGISLYEYFTDKAEGREPIVTAYNFK
ncbi:MAG: pyridine nucleotide-disulfide oxidoreductase [Ruminococcaceae bacterium]|nr:pyridine nucleotide-disulfide oxidoreductase [Oscillospiraceae bacterium]